MSLDPKGKGDPGKCCFSEPVYSGAKNKHWPAPSSDKGSLAMYLNALYATCLKTVSATKMPWRAWIEERATGREILREGPNCSKHHLPALQRYSAQAASFNPRAGSPEQAWSSIPYRWGNQALPPEVAEALEWKAVNRPFLETSSPTVHPDPTEVSLSLLWQNGAGKGDLSRILFLQRA